MEKGQEKGSKKGAKKGRKKGTVNDPIEQPNRRLTRQCQIRWRKARMEIRGLEWNFKSMRNAQYPYVDPLH